jgi:capsular exopolysaccharide synthesis family protein
MEPRQYLKAIVSGWFIIVAGAIVGFLVANAYAATVPEIYRASSSLFVSATKGSNPAELQQGSTFVRNQIPSYTLLADQVAVLKPVVDQLRLDMSVQQLASKVSAENPLNTSIISISVESDSPDEAAKIANAVALSLQSIVISNAPETTDGKASISMVLTSPAIAPLDPIAPDVQLIQLSGLGIGLVVGFLAALLREVLDTRIKSEKDLRLAGKVEALGSIPRSSRGRSAIAFISAPHGQTAEGFRRLRSYLQFSNIDTPLKSVTVTSTIAGDGKSTVAINLALAMAETDRRVLLIDADLRAPSIAAATGTIGTVGLTTVLVGKASIDDAIQPWTPLLDILTSGELPSMSGRILASHKMRDLVAQLEDRYDFVVIDSPPLLPTADALAISHLTDGAIIVAAFKKTRRSELTRVISDLTNANATIIGVVLNGTRPERRKGLSGFGRTGPARSQRSVVSRLPEVESKKAVDDFEGEPVDETVDAGVEAQQRGATDSRNATRLGRESP